MKGCFLSEEEKKNGSKTAWWKQRGLIQKTFIKLVLQRVDQYRKRNNTTRSERSDTLNFCRSEKGVH